MAVKQQPSLSDSQSDPLRNFMFVVTFKPATSHSFTGGFITVSGLSTANVAIIPYQQGGMNVTTRNMPAQGTYQPLILTSGSITTTGANVEWMNHLYTVIQGTGTNVSALSDFRMNMDIWVLSHPSNTKERSVKAGWRVYNAWPSNILWGDLDAGDNGLLIEQMTLCHEGIDMSIAAPGTTNEIPWFG